MDGATPLNTPPATDRGLSEEDVALVVATFGHCPKEGESLLINRFGLSALLAAARREGEGAARDHDHSTDTSGDDRPQMAGEATDLVLVPRAVVARLTRPVIASSGDRTSVSTSDLWALADFKEISPGERP